MATPARGFILPVVLAEDHSSLPTLKKNPLPSPALFPAPGAQPTQLGRPAAPNCHGTQQLVNAGTGDLCRGRLSVRSLTAWPPPPYSHPQVLNPPNSAKSEGREILKLASQEYRHAQWVSYAARYGITAAPEVSYRCVARDAGMAPYRYPDYCPEWAPAPEPALAAFQAAVAMAVARSEEGDGTRGE